VRSVDYALMMLDDAPADREPETNAASTFTSSSEEFIEHALFIAGRETRPLISDDNDDIVRAFESCNLYRRSRLCVLCGIFQNVPENFFDEYLVDTNKREIRGNVDRQVSAT